MKAPATHDGHSCLLVLLVLVRCDAEADRAWTSTLWRCIGRGPRGAWYDDDAIGGACAANWCARAPPAGSIIMMPLAVRSGLVYFSAEV